MYPQRPYERVVSVVKVGVDGRPRLAARHPKVGAPAFLKRLMSLEGKMHRATLSSAENTGSQLPQNFVHRSAVPEKSRERINEQTVTRWQRQAKSLSGLAFITTRLGCDEIGIGCRVDCRKRLSEGSYR